MPPHDVEHPQHGHPLGRRRHQGGPLVGLSAEVAGRAGYPSAFTVQAGETLALNGPYGRGKSSTVHAVLQPRRPDGGEVHLQGRELTGLTERALRPLRDA